MATINWVNSAGGDFGVAANWSTDSVPFLNDDLTVSGFGQYLVTISDNNQANSLTFNAPQAALQENAGSLSLTGTLVVNSGFLSLNEANRIGDVEERAASSPLATLALWAPAQSQSKAANCSRPPTKPSRTPSGFLEIRRSPPRMEQLSTKAHPAFSSPPVQR